MNALKDGEAIWRGVRGQGKASRGSAQRFRWKDGSLAESVRDAEGIDE